MSRGRGKPLFDLISGPTREDGPGRRASPPPLLGLEQGNGRIAVPMTWAYVALAVVIVLLVASYGVGYRVGVSAERAEMQQFAARDADRVFKDPISGEHAAPAQPNPSRGTDSADRRESGDTRQTTPPENPGRAAGEILSADGPLDVDPRIVGSNYLELATLPKAQAIAAVRYLASKDEPAIAVPGVDRGGSGRNTSGRYRVIALGLAVPGDRFSSMKAQRERFERRLARLGKAWADAGGASDFSDPLWRRHGG